ncbi:hypothetical protein Emag_006820 [Eimeria magna]
MQAEIACCSCFCHCCCCLYSLLLLLLSPRLLPLLLLYQLPLLLSLLQLLLPPVLARDLSSPLLLLQQLLLAPSKGASAAGVGAATTAAGIAAPHTETAQKDNICILQSSGPQGPKETLKAALAAAIGAAAAALLLLCCCCCCCTCSSECGLAAAATAAVLSVVLLPAADGFAVDSVPAFLVASTLHPAKSPLGPPRRGAPLTAAVVGVSDGAFLRTPALAAAAAAAADNAAAAAADDELNRPRTGALCAVYAQDAVGGGDTVTKRELVERVAVELSLPRSQVEKTVSLFNTFIQQDLAAGKRVYVSKLGTFGLRRRGPRSARNPKTGAPLEAPAATFPSFSFSRNVKEAVRETVPLFEDAEESPPPHQTHQHRQQQHHTKKDSKLFGWLP